MFHSYDHEWNITTEGSRQVRSPVLPTARKIDENSAEVSAVHGSEAVDGAVDRRLHFLDLVRDVRV